ncbi:hypothetical protein [uncultured Marinobacter sp.]|uniref:hypothetical protein n=1 Tax=uncultured Marinobacter sp. TaxID=187379 RepID=UPI0030D81A60
MVGNLTTITGSVESFAVALLGFYWVHQLHGNADKDNREKLIRDTFLRYEQLAAYLRYQSGSKEIMGITRVQKNMSTGANQLPISLRSQILSDQASYGLWGLYSSALKDSGLVEGSERKPTQKGTELAQAICKHLDINTFIALFRQEGELPKETCEKLAPQYWKALKQDEVCDELTHVLLRGNQNNDASAQGQLFDVTRDLIKRAGIQDEFGANLNTIEAMAHGLLKQRLADIQQVERVLVAANNLFYYLLTQDHHSLSDVLAELEKKQYVYDHLPEALPEGIVRHNLLSEINQNLRAGNQRAAIQAVIKLNASVMKDRGGAPWVSCESGDILNVKVKSETARLREQSDLLNKWDYDYFLGSYLRIAKANLGVAHG